MSTPETPTKSECSEREREALIEFTRTLEDQSFGDHLLAAVEVAAAGSPCLVMIAPADNAGTSAPQVVASAAYEQLSYAQKAELLDRIQGMLRHMEFDAWAKEREPGALEERQEAQRHLKEADFPKKADKWWRKYDYSEWALPSFEVYQGFLGSVSEIKTWLEDALELPNGELDLKSEFGCLDEVHKLLFSLCRTEAEVLGIDIEAALGWHHGRLPPVDWVPDVYLKVYREFSRPSES